MKEPSSPQTFVASLLISAGARVAEIAVAGDRLVVHEAGNGAHRLVVYSASNGKHLRELIVVRRIGPFAGKMVVLPDGRSIVTTFVDGEITEIDLESGETRRTVSTPRAANGLAKDGGELAVSPDGSTVYCAVWTEVYAWTLATNELAQIDRASVPTSMQRLAMSNDGAVLWFGGNRLSRLDIATSAPADVPFDADDGPTDLAVLGPSGTNEVVVVGKSDGRVEIWSNTAPPTKQAVVVTAPNASHATRLGVLRDGSVFAASGADQRVSLLTSSDVAPRAHVVGVEGDIGALASDRRETLWIGAGDDVWRVDLGGTALETRPGKAKPKAVRMSCHSSPVLEVVPYTRDHAITIAGYHAHPPATREVCVWKRGERDAIAYRAFPRRKLGDRVAMTTGQFLIVDDGSSGLQVIDASSEKLETVVKLAHKDADGAAVSPDGKLLVTTGGTELKVWSTTDWQVVRSRRGADVPRGARKWLAAKGDDEAVVFFVDRADTLGFFFADDLRRAESSRLGYVETILASPRASIVAVTQWILADRASERGARLDAEIGRYADVAHLQSLAAQMETTTRRVRLWSRATNTTVDLPPGTRSASFGEDDTVTVVEEKGAFVARFRPDGTELARVDLRPHMSLAGVPRTAASCIARGPLAFVDCIQPPHPSVPFRTAQSVVVDLTTGAVKPHERGAVAFDGDSLLSLTKGGRIVWTTLGKG